MASGIGQVLRDARRGSGASLHDVAVQTKIRETYLAALERDDFDALGMDPVYVRGNLRTYADYLGLDAESLVARYSANGGGSPAVGASTRTVAAPSGRRRRRRWLAPVIGGLLLLVVLGGAALALSDVLRERVLGMAPADEPAQRTEQVPAAAPQPAASAPAAADAGNSGRPVTSVIIPQPPNDATLGDDLELKLEFVDLVWIRVIVDGEEAFEGLVKKGTVQEYGADETIEMRIGVADGIEFTVNRAWYGPIAGSVDGPVNVVCTAGESCQIAEQQ